MAAVAPMERRDLNDIARMIGLSSERQQILDETLARRRFAESLARAMDDGELSEVEIKALDQIAIGAGVDVREFTQRFFVSEGEAFLRSVFANAVAERGDPRASVDRLIATAQRLGFSREQSMAIIRTQASRFVEHVLADAKSDEEITSDEEDALLWMIDNLQIPENLRSYVQSELDELRELSAIARGRIAAQSPPEGLSTKSGELVYFHDRAQWRFTRDLKKGPVVKEHEGTFVVTDVRLAFLSFGRAHTVPLRKIVWLSGGPGLIQVQSESKPVDWFQFRTMTRVPLAITQAALDMCNQKMIRLEDNRRSRHIPRDVRQRVWQIYSGRCAECGSDSYLEFDHIVPVAKGGSNSDANVQLLCRGCNSQKSDLI